MEKKYTRDKERVALYIPFDIRDEWMEFLKNNDDISSISQLIIKSVSDYIQKSSKKK